MRWTIALALAGCSFKGSGSTGTIDASSDARVDESPAPDAPDAAPGFSCLGEGELAVCVPTPTMPFEVTGTSNTGINTDANPAQCTFVSQPGRPTLCVIAGTTITISQNILFLGGTHPVVLFATDSIVIARGVDVGSHYAGQALGAGANSASCIAGSGAGSDSNGGDGGAGGSFGTPGGNGGAGGNTAAGDTAGAIGDPYFLRGGCPGGRGGNGNGVGTGGAGNHGGGAILLLAGSSISISGFVCASGAGGNRGTQSKGGGGGGGSGGMIAMSAPTITVTSSGRLLANGGGGGGGASASGSGMPGLDPNPMMPLNTASGGGNGGGPSTAGASGAAGGTAATSSTPSAEGAGGGGGGHGVIRILSGQNVGGTASPSPRTN